MSRIYQQVAVCAPSQHADVYIFAIAPITNRGLAAITSADELLFLDRDGLDKANVSRLRTVPSGITSLVSADQGQTVICGGSDGKLAVFDLRAESGIAHYSSGRCRCRPSPKVVMVP